MGNMQLIFDATTYEYLRKMRWTPHREVLPAPFLACLVADGYTVFPKAKQFFQRFGGLGGDMPAYRVEGALDRIDFDPARAIACTCRETVREYEARVQEQLAVIGMAYNGYMTLLLSESGRMFGGYDDFLCLIGTDVQDGMNKLFNRRQMPELP
ncbi:SUKH-3 domain-containing protein [Massilia sp. CCM 8734]|uniref:SUKH-3 domain-containing protein n=1 Tax=Massilia sp. CCM 8734 TaxID=2609283 RepID=UPI00141EAC8C|nr:SUKH-3 domain-containing protein [Massilia sp. CCM 8734]NHZ95130.1 hypothetical protein [Massilia sp. CCM 8734]